MSTHSGDQMKPAVHLKHSSLAARIVASSMFCVGLLGCSGQTPVSPASAFRSTESSSAPATSVVSTLPTKPELVTSTTITPPGPTAKLQMESLSIKVYGPNAQGRYGYVPRFMLREVGGQLGATIEYINIFDPQTNSWNATGPTCWGTPLHVAANGVLDTFFTDQGADWLSYCAPGTEGTSPKPTLRIVITFASDNGASGTLDVSYVWPSGS